MSNKQKLEELFGKIQKSKWIDAARESRENQHWLQYSQEIAIAVWEQLQQKKITQKMLADEMKVSPQLINKWLKGKENFTLDTISKLEAVLGIKLVKIGVDSNRIPIPIELLPKFSEEYKMPEKYSENTSSFTSAKVIKMPPTEYLKNAK